MLLLALLVSATASAQKIGLAKGQIITIITTSTQDIDMQGMGMQMKNNTNGTSVVEVKDSDKNNFTTTYKLSKINLTMDMMGQQTSYDSEKPEDKETEMSKAFAEKIGKEVIILIDKNTGKAILNKKDTASQKAEESNTLDGLMNSFGAIEEDAAVETALFIIPPGKKTGDSWLDSTNNKGMKELKTFTLKSIDGNMASIGMFSTLQGSNTMEMQGMQMDITISAKTEGEIVVNTKSSLVKKRSSVMDLTGSIEIMGQSVPVTSKAIVNIDYK